MAATKATKVEEEFVSLSNTSGFESIFYLLYAAAQDFEYLKNYLEQHRENNRMCKLIAKNFKDKFSYNYTYKTRADILKNLYPDKTPGKFKIIQGNVNVEIIITRLFLGSPCCKSLSSCSNLQCSPQNKVDVTKILFCESINASELQDIDSLFAENQTCNKNNCKNARKTELTEIGICIKYLDLFYFVD